MDRLKDGCLRDLFETDLDLVLSWRNSDRIRMNMYTDRIISVQEHHDWYQKYHQTKTAIYKIFALRGVPSGLVYFTEINTAEKQCHWGFYLGRDDLPKGTGICMGILSIDYVFQDLKMDVIIGEVFAFNEASIKYHERLGFQKWGNVSKTHEKNGCSEIVRSFRLDKNDWVQAKPKLVQGK